jgi:hypothetical protein
MPKKKRKYYKFKTADNKKYTLKFRAPHKTHNADGLCDHPESKKPQIWIDPKLLPKRKLAVLIEEIFHAFFFEKTEREARKFAATLTKFIYTTGWRPKG